MARKIGIQARPAIEQLLGRKIYLELHVKVRPKWRQNDAMLERFGL
jgi:GTP-binding protein Era